MVSQRQLEANRQNAKNSTGPRTEDGKRRSRRNAVRHGLTAETILEVHEDPAAYRAFERDIRADYCPRTNFELELIDRLVSLLWRLRRAVAIESGLFDLHNDASIERRTFNGVQTNKHKLDVFYALIRSSLPEGRTGIGQQDEKSVGNVRSSRRTRQFSESRVARADLTRSFRRFARIDGIVFERLGRYEKSLWRQAIETMLLLNSINRSRDGRCADYDHKYLRLRQRQPHHILWPPFQPLGPDQD